MLNPNQPHVLKLVVLASISRVSQAALGNLVLRINELEHRTKGVSLFLATNGDLSPTVYPFPVLLKEL
ncbi:hypothetical protein ACB087_01150 [Vibrio sp. VNB-15]